VENNSSIKTFGVLVVAVVAFSFGIVFGRSVNTSDINIFNTRSSAVNQDLFWEVWNVMENKYVEKDKVSEEEMMFGAIKGMVDSYGDPATIFLTPEETKKFNEANQGKYFEGIGAELGYENGSIIVVAPIDGSPAKAAGIRAGDYILAVDDYELKANDNIYDVVQRIRGEAGTKVVIKVLHKGDMQPTEIEITRGSITVPSMSLSYVGEKKDIALIDVARFTDSSFDAWTKNWDEVVNEVYAKGVNKVIVDLRGNPGGYFDAAIYSADDFLDSGKVISKQEDGSGKVQEFTSKRGGRLLGKKVIVLVDNGSASASEIFAGALQKNGVGQVVGTKTYGKGTAQSVLDLRGGSSLHITILKWLLPDGVWLNRDNPITPDVIIENTTEDFVAGMDKQMDEALRLINN
jgi:carboxyl-terminal processing protease